MRLKNHYQAIFIFCFSIFSSALFSQEIVYGTNEYIAYQIGTLPVVISVPHGGYLNPSNIPDRTCNSAVTVTDANTIELADAINTAFFEQTGCYPHIVYCYLDRAKLDCNRNEADGACGNTDAITAWNEFHDFIDQAQQDAQAAYEGNILFIDLHGHGHTIQRVELGYLLYDDELALSDATLNTSQYVGYSSIQNLAANNANNYTHAELLRGEVAFGTLLANRGFPSVPSQQDPAPNTTDYFSGGYITANHTSYAIGNSVNGFQMECNYDGVRDNPSNRKQFADSLATTALQYLAVHREVSTANCGPNNTLELDLQPLVSISPNPITENQTALTATGLPSANMHFHIVNAFGQTIAVGEAQNNTIPINTQWPKGVYTILWTNNAGWHTYSRFVM